jgi:hypothetical protein
MDETNDPGVIKLGTFTDKQIFTKIWSQPRLIFRYVHENNHDKYTHILLVFAAIGRGLDRAAMKSMGDNSSLATIIIMSILAGGLFGWLTYYIYAAMVSWTGKGLKGVANTQAILRVLAYGMIPAVLSLPIIVLQISLFGNAIFQSEIDFANYSLPVEGVYYLSLVVEMTLGIWTICLVVAGISEVQKFSVIKSILNLMLPGLIILGIIVLFLLALM